MPTLSAEMPFVLEIYNRQRGPSFDAGFMMRVGLAAYPACLEATTEREVPLRRLREVEVTILSDRRIGQVHAEFFGDPAPTDVITFHHGEILLGAGIVRENAARFRRSPDEEAALCLVHGLLHLAGWRDDTDEAAKKMADRQEQIFKSARAVV